MQRLGHEHLAGPGHVDDPRGHVDVVTDEVVTAGRGSAPVKTDPDPQRQERVSRLALERLLQVEAGRERGCGGREPEQQAVAELLHDASARRQRAAHELFLEREERHRLVVAPHRAELREAHDVGEGDGARRTGSAHQSGATLMLPASLTGAALLAHQSGSTWMLPDVVATEMLPSSPSSQSQRILPLTLRRRNRG